MVNYIGNMLGDTPEDMRVESEILVAHDLFDISEDATKLPWTEADLFHRIVAQILYLTSWARPDIQLAVFILCSRVIEPDADDYNKLAMVMKYIQGAIGPTLILSIENLSI